MARIDADSLYGTLALLVLRTLAAEGPLHGLGVARRIEGLAGEALRIEEDFRALMRHRLERDGFLSSSWGTSENNRRAKFYALTAAGRLHLEGEVERWVRHARAVARVLDLAWEPVA
ncbi:MAG: helix-turn-helix transcriptional regulator [Gemmatimonadetes bacterium]|nr:helix-turn-helix transcriptional regulator [Gemmatimonadota bacterium]